MLGPAGKRNKRVVLQRLVNAPTAGGETTDDFITVATVWAAIEPLKGDEAWNARAQQATTTHMMSFVYVAGITPGMRAVHGSRIFQLESVVNVREENRELLCSATEVL